MTKEEIRAAAERIAEPVGNEGPAVWNLVFEAAEREITDLVQKAREEGWEEGHQAGREKSPTYKENQELRDMVEQAREEALEEAAGLLDAEVQQHLAEGFSHNFCEDYGHTNLTEFAEAIRSLREKEKA